MGIYLGIDVGTSSTKTIAINAKGRVLADWSVPYRADHPEPAWSEQDPENWWQATKQTVRAVIRQAKAKPSDVRTIGLTGQMHGSVFLDAQQQVIRPAILWNDQRTAEECEQIESRVGGRAKLIKMVANPALSGFTAPKILWLRNREPRNFDRLSHVLLPKDEVRRRLTGEFATDVSDASGTLLLDVVRRKWSKKLLSLLELDRSLLADCYESHEITGSLTPTAAKQLGLTTKCQVVAGAGDCAAGAVGTGVVKGGTLSASIGTSGVMFVHADEPRVDPAGRLHTFCHAVDGKWHLMGVTLTAGGALSWFLEQLCPELAKSASDPFKLVVAEARAIPVGSEGLFFLPYLAGERTPHADPHARGCWIGLTLKHGRGHVVRALMEGVSYALRDSLAIMQELEIPIRETRLTGGGAKDPFWRQLLANVLGQRIVTLNAEQGPAYGAALLAAVGGGEFRNITEATKATIKTATSTTVDRVARRTYSKSFPVFQQLYRSLRNDFEKLS